MNVSRREVDAVAILADFPDAVLTGGDDRPLRKINPLAWRMPFSDLLRFAEMVVASEPRFHHPARPDLVARSINLWFDGVFDPKQPEVHIGLAIVYFTPVAEARVRLESTR
jgi:hypothetical protein